MPVVREQVETDTHTHRQTHRPSTVTLAALLLERSDVSLLGYLYPVSVVEDSNEGVGCRPGCLLKDSVLLDVDTWHRVYSEQWVFSVMAGWVAPSVRVADRSMKVSRLQLPVHPAT